MSLPDPFYAFLTLSAFGFFTQWIVMILNGTLVAMFMAAWHSVLPTGIPVKTTWTGIWPIDYVLGILVVFFCSIADVAELPDMRPFLLLVDLISALAVCNMMTLVAGRRNPITGSLRL